MEDTSRESTIYIRDLPADISREEVKDLFNGQGKVTDVHIPVFHDSGCVFVFLWKGIRKRRGFCYVAFSDHGSADDALKEFNGKEVNGHALVLEWARGKRKTASEMRDYERGRDKRSRSYDRRPRREREPVRGHSRSRSGSVVLIDFRKSKQLFDFLSILITM